MGLDNVIIGTDEAAAAAIAVSFEPAITRGMQGFWAPGVDAATSLRNLWSGVGGVGDASVQGAPTYASSFATFKANTNFLQTAAAETDSCTMFAVARCLDTLADNAHRPFLIGNQTNGAGVGLTMRPASGGGALPAADVAIYGTYDDGAGNAVASNTALIVPDVTQWNFYCAVVEAGIGRRIYAKTTAQAVTSAADARARKRNAATSFRIGSAQQGGYAGTVDVALGGSCGLALTAAEIEALYQSCKTFLSVTRGITI